MFDLIRFGVPSLRIALLASLVAACPRAQELTVGGRVVDLATVRTGLRESTIATIEAWLPFAEARGYRLVISEPEDLILLLHAGHARTQARRERPTVQKFVSALTAARGCVGPLLPEAPEDAAPAVLVGTVEADYAELLAHITRVEPRIAGWAAARAGNVAGFVLSEPCVAAWLDDGRGQEEWDARHELVHRAAQLLLRRAAPQQPSWASLGLGWHVEESVLGAIYCFPHRAGFVWAAEHTGWEGRLKTAFQANRRRGRELPPVLGIDEIADWDPMRDETGFDADRALVAFGLARHLADIGAASAVFRDFDAAIRAGWKVRISDTEWTTDPDYRLPPSAQDEILERGEPGFLRAATDAFAKGRLGRSVPPRRRSAAD
jgi:hypothetical protein